MNNYRKGVFLVLMTACISGFSIWLNAFAVKGITPNLLAALKNSFVGLFFVGSILLTGSWRRVVQLTRREWLKLALIGLVGGSVPFVLFFNALKMTSAGQAGFIQKTMFIYVALLSMYFLKERMSKAMLIGLSSLFIGQYIFLHLTFSRMTMGDLMVFIATVLWAIEMVISKQTMQTVPPKIVAGARMLFGAAFIWIYLLATQQWQGVGHLSGFQWQWVAVTTMLLIGYVATLYTGLKYVPAQVAASLLALGAPITLALSVTMHPASLGFGEILGALIMSASCFIIVFAAQQRIAPSHYVLARDHQ